MSTQPTDAEISSLYAEQTGFDLSDSPAALLDFARAVLAKWGTPAPVGAVPVAWWIPKAEQFALADKSGDRPFAKAWEPLYATPQPTQTQAVAEPLTPDQIAEIADAAHREYDRLVSSGQCAPRWSAVFAHLLEMHHSIKGGQHAD